MVKNVTESCATFLKIPIKMKMSRDYLNWYYLSLNSCNNLSSIYTAKILNDFINKGASRKVRSSNLVLLDLVRLNREERPWVPVEQSQLEEGFLHMRMDLRCIPFCHLQLTVLRQTLWFEHLNNRRLWKKTLNDMLYKILMILNRLVSKRLE